MKRAIATSILTISFIVGLGFVYIIIRSVCQLLLNGIQAIEEPAALFVGIIYLILLWSSYTSYAHLQKHDFMYKWLD